jgi:hypothetical protein
LRLYQRAFFSFGVSLKRLFSDTFKDVYGNRQSGASARLSGMGMRFKFQRRFSKYFK